MVESQEQIHSGLVEGRKSINGQVLLVLSRINHFALSLHDAYFASQAPIQVSTSMPTKFLDSSSLHLLDHIKHIWLQLLCPVGSDPEIELQVAGVCFECLRYTKNRIWWGLFNTLESAGSQMQAMSGSTSANACDLRGSNL